MAEDLLYRSHQLSMIQSHTTACTYSHHIFNVWLHSTSIVYVQYISHCSCTEQLEGSEIIAAYKEGAYIQ